MRLLFVITMLGTSLLIVCLAKAGEPKFYPGFRPTTVASKDFQWDRQGMAKFAAVKSTPQPFLHWEFFGASWCGPCQAQKSEFTPLATASGYSIGDRPTDHIQLIDGEKNPQARERRRVESYPTAILMSGDREVARLVGLHTWQQMVDAYEKERARASQEAEAKRKAMGSITIATLPMRSEVNTFIDVVTPVINAGGQIDLGWSSNAADLTFRLTPTARVKIPKATALKWSVVDGGVQVSLSKSIYLQPVSWTSFEIRGLIIKRDGIEADIPRFFNAYIALK